MKTTTRIAHEIAAGATDAGATAEMIRSYDLTQEDCAYIREEWRKPDAGESDEEAAARCEVEDWRHVYAEVESAVRESGFAS